MWSNYIYIHIDKKENKIVSSGIDFHEFTEALGKCTNYLILTGESVNTNFNQRLMLEYICNARTKDFVEEDVENWGDFCWVDFEDESLLDCISNSELAELLYMAHVKKPLKKYKIESLNNSIAYLCHDDGIWNEVYIEDVESYKKILKYVLSKYCRCHIVIHGDDENDELDNSDKTIDRIFDLTYSGLVMDFSESDKGYIYLYKTGEEIDNIDRLEDIVCNYKKIAKIF